MYCRASVDKDHAVDDSRINVSKLPISPAGPTASDLRMSKLLEETLQSFNMFESDDGMQARLLLHFCYKPNLICCCVVVILLFHY